MLKTIFYLFTLNVLFYNLTAQVCVDFNESTPVSFQSNTTIDEDEEMGKYAQTTNGILLPEVDSLEFDKEISFAMWIKPQQLRYGPTTLFGRHKSFYLRTLSSGSLQFILGYKRQFTTPKLLDANNWQQVCFTVSKRRLLKIYLNGCFVYKKVLPAELDFSIGEFILCTDHLGNSYTDPFNHVFISNKRLHPHEVAQLYQDTKVNITLKTGWLAHYALDGHKQNDISFDQKAEYSHIEIVEDSLRGKVADFSHEQARISIPSCEYDNELTLSMWTKLQLPKIPGPNKYAIVGSNEFSLMLKFTDPQRIVFNIPLRLTVNAELQNVAFEQWNHIAMTLQFNDTACFYFNGELVYKHPMSEKNQSAVAWTLGKTFWSDRFNGQMAGFSFWNRALYESEIKQVYENDFEVPYAQRNYTIILLTFFVAFVVFIGFWFYKKHKMHRLYNMQLTPIVAKKNALYLFDTFNAYDRDGHNISAEFTPRLIQLLSAIILYDIKYAEGIQSSQLSSVVWGEDDDKKRLKVNRNSNIARLKKVLGKIDYLELIYKNNRWSLIAHEGCYIDIIHMVRHIELGEMPSQLYQSGRVCEELIVPGFDALRAPLNTFFIDNCQQHCQQHHQSHNYHELYKWSQFWLSIDDLSIDALRYNVNALFKEGQQRLAEAKYKEFALFYKKVMGQEVEFDFLSCMKW